MIPPETESTTDPTDPVVIHARREAIVIGLAWLGCTIYCCVASYALGYITPDRPLGPEDVRPILGIPSWAIWGYLVPWLACGVFTIWFAGWYMVDDDLGGDDDG
ncbi:hypothetical protein TA3x_003186 [Tundrisphaera sp. TA3]|uniref:hypothetical protein n=1 Tax=Tundrisphaera sp. TA3 TaxID=3435775 RepID=UPI003EB8379A